MTATTTVPTTFQQAQDVLAARLPGYKRRPQQEQLAEAIEKVFTPAKGNDGSVAISHLLAQAGTGTGKSLAAAIPAILSGKRIIIATTTIALMTQYCVAPETRVLTADLRHIPAGDVVEGMELVGFDEERVGQRRRYRRAIVESVETIQRPCYRLTFDDGTEIVASTEHQWLCRRGPNIKWMTTENLCVEKGSRPGSKVIRLTDVWDTNTSYEAGYLAAAYDGEGHLSQAKSKQVDNGVMNRLAFSQKDNEMQAQVHSYLASLGFKAEAWDRGDIHVTGMSTRRDIMRFLGQIRPARLLPKFDVDGLGTINTGDGVRVIRKEYIGTQDVIAMQTSTGTFVAEGLASHNCTKDLPFLQAHLGKSFTWAALKGIGNFACLSKLDQRPAEVELLDDLIDELGLEKKDEDGKPLPVTHTGDRDDITTPLTRQELRLITSSSDECPGKKKCAFAERCFGMRHKAEAMDAQVVITNTAMLMTDVKLNRQIRETSENGEGAHVVLGEYDALVIDEAHELEAVATDHLGYDIKKGGVLTYIDQATSFINIQSGAEAGAEKFNEKINKGLEAIGVILDEHLGKEESAKIDVAFMTTHFEIFEALFYNVKAMHDAVEATTIERGSKQAVSDTKQRLVAMGKNFLDHIKEVIQAEDQVMVRWAERYRTKTGLQWVIKTAPIDVAPILRRELWSTVPAVLMSATLATSTGSAKFAYITRSLGLDGADTLDVGTPFDYEAQSLLYYPGASIPDPGYKTRAEWEAVVPDLTKELVYAARGGAMLLYTSRAAMKRAYEIIAPSFEKRGYTCFLQGGDLTNKEMAVRFRDDENSVLFGLRSFMTGMDFPGKTNRLVVIDKLPFPVPSDPIFEAREKAVRARGGEPFMDLSVPIMTLILQQAYGRLIRTVEDWGAVAILDSRLATKPYGHKIVKALPGSRAVTSLPDVENFFTGWREAPVTA